MDDLQDRVGSGMNDSGTCEKSGTRLTHTRSPGVLGFTYFVRVGNAIKIGAATDFKKRLGSLQTGHPEPMEVLAVVPAALVDEFKAHQLFAHLRIRGEWFRADHDLLYFIEQAKIDAMNEPAPILEPAKPKPVVIVSSHDQIRRLINARAKEYGANTQKGHAASNLVEQLKHLRKATGAQRANLLKAIPYQMARLSGP